jgi:hypothetical protein
VIGQYSASSGQGVAIWGETASTNSSSAGVYAAATAGTSKALWAEVRGAGTGVAVYGKATSPALAGLFDGDVSVRGNLSVNGNLSKPAGSFKIDHPLDPANKYLYHSFVESPDMKNLYDGVVVLDDRGEATVTLPDWFEALNRDFRYQLTAVGAPMPGLYVAQKVAQNHFRIAGGEPGGEVSWQVTGTRQDAWANAHRIPVEEDKPAAERGSYLFPEGFGAAPQVDASTPRSARGEQRAR